MNKLTAIIVDDESLARRGLKLRLEQHESLTVLAEHANGREAITTVKKLKPDLLFLDIQMPGMDGFEVVRQLDQNTLPLIVFVTAYDKYAIKAFESHAIDYILKPVEEEKLNQTIQRVTQTVRERRADQDKTRLLNMMEHLTGTSAAEIEENLIAGHALTHKYPDKISIRDGGKITRVSVSQVDWIDAAGDYMCLHVSGVTHIMRTSMKQLEEQLNPVLFQRIHRSTIVNLNRIQGISNRTSGDSRVTLECGKQLRMSRSYKNKVQRLLTLDT